MDDRSSLFWVIVSCMVDMGDLKTMKNKIYTSIGFHKKASKHVYEIRGALLKETEKDWTLSKVVNLMLLYAVEHGVTKDSLKKMEKQYESDG